LLPLVAVTVAPPAAPLALEQEIAIRLARETATPRLLRIQTPFAWKNMMTKVSFLCLGLFKIY
jgi:hypothetical protein